MLRPLSAAILSTSVEFLAALNGCADVDAVVNRAVRNLPTLLDACGVRLTLRAAGGRCRSWLAGTCPPLAPARVGKAEATMHPVRWHRHQNELFGRILLAGRCEATVFALRAVGYPFNDDDESRWAFALEHLAKAMDRASRYAAARQSSQIMAAALDNAPWPVLILDEHGAIMFRNQAALPYLAQGGLTEQIAAASTALAQAVGPTGSVGRCIPVSDGDPWQLTPLRLPDGSASVIISRPAAPCPHFVLGELTHREQAVAALVAQGLTNSQIAVALSVSANTVKHHLKAVFVKLKVTSRAQLVAQVMTSKGGDG